MIRSDVAVMCGKRGNRKKDETRQRASRRKGANVSVICAEEAREASGT